MASPSRQRRTATGRCQEFLEIYQKCGVAWRTASETDFTSRRWTGRGSGGGVEDVEDGEGDEES